ncbi:MAG TPA: KH domain-containing protein [Clostridia bacterium]|nr:KH domain-containing protein [Clostridia bacterium]HPQ46025.1 KH domain-containing protein [Clostridia bacterium]HRX41970.1 KH domain-containing protein [Clostridia bacterium]
MKELLEMIIKALVDNPDDVRINVIEEELNTILEVHVADDDMGRIIGKRGKIAKAIRSLMKAYAIKENKHILVEIVD